MVKRLAVIGAGIALLIGSLVSAPAANAADWQITYGYAGSYAWAENPNANVIIGQPATDFQGPGGHCAESRLYIQRDGNLVQYSRFSDVGSCPSTWRVDWATNTYGSGETFVLQRDNNAVIYRGGVAIWASHTNTSYQTSHYFRVQVNGCSVILDAYGAQQWYDC